MDGKLLDIIKDVSRKIRDTSGMIRVLTHYDADGLASGGAISRLLYNLNKEFNIMTSETLSNTILEEFFSVNANLYIILDMGSSYLDSIKDYVIKDNKDVIIIDHHKINPEINTSDDIGDRIYIVNPEFFGLDGGKVGCTSILSSLIGYYGCDEHDKYFLEIGVVGAVGDMQLPYNLIDINKYLVDLAVKNRILEIKREFIFFTLRDLPIHKAIVWNMVPYIPDFSGREDVGLNIVKKSGIKYRKKSGEFILVKELTEDERSRLLESIFEYIASKFIGDLSINDFIRDEFYLNQENDPHLRTATDFSNILSSCGRMDREDIGILLGMGARGKILDESLAIYEARKKKLVKYLKKAEENMSIIDGFLCVVDLSNEDFSSKFSGTISTILSRSLNYRKYIIVVLSRSDNLIKISSRAPSYLVDKGLDLSRIMWKLSRKLGGNGGGHNIAAGALIPSDSNQIKALLLELLKDELDNTGLNDDPGS